MRPQVILIAAVSADGFISRDQGVPWDLPEDRAHFRRLTAGKWLLLGRRTFDEMQGWFRDHHPLVLTRRALPERWAEAAVTSVEEAMARVADAGERELWVCGGGAAYAEAWPRATQVVLTRVQEDLGHGVAFPKVADDEWRVVRNLPGGGVGDQVAWKWIWYERCQESPVANEQD